MRGELVADEKQASITPTPIPSSGPSPTACSGTVTVSCTMKAKNDGSKLAGNIVYIVISLTFAVVQTF